MAVLALLGVAGGLLGYQFLWGGFEARANLDLVPSSVLQAGPPPSSYSPDQAVRELETPEVLGGVAVRLGQRPSRRRAAQLRRSLIVVQRSDRRKLELVAKADSASAATRLVNAWAGTFVARRKQVLRADLERARRRSTARLTRLLRRPATRSVSIKAVVGERRRQRAVRRALAVQTAAVTAPDAEIVQSGTVRREGLPPPVALLLGLGAGLGVLLFTGPRQSRRPADPAREHGPVHTRSEEPLRILFVCSGDFRAPSEKQVLRFAEGLTERGHSVGVSLGGNPRTAREEGADRRERLHVWRHEFRGPKLSRAAERACVAFRPTLIHAFNARTPVIAATARYSELTGAPALVHFEDDEWGLGRPRPGEPAARTAGRAVLRLLSAGQPSLWPFATRRSLAWVGEHAVALDALTPALASHVEGRLGRPCAVVLPPVSGVSPRPGARTGDSGGDAVVAYTGSVFGAHLDDFRLALRAVARLRAHGRAVRFVHAGRMARRLRGPQLAVQAGLPSEAASFLGYRPAVEVERLMAGAAVLVQPGAPTEFNRLRLPSKLPGYLASGTPTVTFAVGAGELLEDRFEVLKTYSGDPEELADRIAEILDDGGLAATLARGGPAAAARLFDPERCTGALLEHYHAALDLRTGAEVAADTGR